MCVCACMSVCGEPLAKSSAVVNQAARRSFAIVHASNVRQHWQLIDGLSVSTCLHFYCGLATGERVGRRRQGVGCARQPAETSAVSGDIPELIWSSTAAAGSR